MEAKLNKKAFNLDYLFDYLTGFSQNLK